MSPLFLHSSASIPHRAARCTQVHFHHSHGFSHLAQVQGATVLPGKAVVLLDSAKLSGSVSKLCDSVVFDVENNETNSI